MTKKAVNYTLIAQILDADPDTGEYLTAVRTVVIESVSKVSAEDRARRFFRKNEVPMKNVVRDDISKTEAAWLGFVGGIPENRSLALKS